MGSNIINVLESARESMSHNKPRDKPPYFENGRQVELETVSC